MMFHCTEQPFILRYSLNTNQMIKLWRTIRADMYHKWGEKRYCLGFSAETWGKEFGRYRRKRLDNNKVVFMTVEWDGVETSGLAQGSDKCYALFWKGKQNIRFHKMRTIPSTTQKYLSSKQMFAPYLVSWFVVVCSFGWLFR